MIVLDNLHWADKPSLLLLEFLGQELGDASLLVVGTYRDVDLSRRHPLAETLGELTRQEHFHRAALRGLSRDDVGRFIQATSGIEPEEHLVKTLHSHTEGNPLFVSEVARMLEQEGELASQPPGGAIGIPEEVREVIGRRFNRLPEQCVQVLTIASVVGREFGLDQMGPLVDDLPQDRLLEVLEEAAAARVIEELPAAMGRYQFTHAPGRTPWVTSSAGLPPRVAERNLSARSTPRRRRYYSVLAGPSWPRFSCTSGTMP